MKQRAAEMVQRYRSVIEECFDSGYDDWVERHRDELTFHGGRTKSSYIWDCIVERLRCALGADPDFRFINTCGTTYIAYGQCFLIKVKKLNRGLRASNVPTRTSERFNHQRQLGFGDDLTHVYLGYVPDDLNTRIEQIHLTCPNGNHVAWSIPVTGDTSSQHPIEFTSEPYTPIAAKKRIKPKTSRERSVASNGS